eukprot:1247697-Amphidinium_carterae.1
MCQTQRINSVTDLISVAQKVPKVVERLEYERVQAHLRQGEPIRLDHAQGISPEAISPPRVLSSGVDQSGVPPTSEHHSRP